MYNNIILDGSGSTANGERILKKINLSLVTKVIIQKTGGIDGGPANVSFHFEDGDVFTVINAFGIGYGGTGPWGIHTVLTNMGVAKEKADEIFTHTSSDPLEILVK